MSNIEVGNYVKVVEAKGKHSFRPARKGVVESIRGTWDGGTAVVRGDDGINFSIPVKYLSQLKPTFKVGDRVKTNDRSLGVGTIVYVNPEGDVCRVNFWDGSTLTYLTAGLTLVNEAIFDVNELVTLDSAPDLGEGKILSRRKTPSGYLYRVAFDSGKMEFYPEVLTRVDFLPASPPDKPLTVHYVEGTKKFSKVGDRLVVPLKDGEVLLLNLKEQTTVVLDADLVSAIRNAHVS